MIILDTNVVSETMKPAPSPSVAAWIRAQSPGSIFLTTITQAEIFYGIAALANGKRREQITAAFEQILAEFHGRLLAFDEDSAKHFGKIAAARDKAGRPISDTDAMIAAIARSHRAAVATRDASGFRGCGIDLINPWEK